MEHFLVESTKINSVGIIGCGTLGRRIALTMVAHGAIVSIYDKEPNVTMLAHKYIHDELILLQKKIGKPVGRLIVCDSLNDAIAHAELVVEAVPEELGLKQSLFAEMEQQTQASCILCSNSSSYPIRQIAARMTAKGRKRVANSHFYMPPVQNPVEIAGCGETDTAVIDALMRKLPGLGFIPFLVKKESIGFIFNRVWAAVKRECLEVVASEVATPEDVDGIYRANLGAPAGPFELMDRIGLDIVYEIEIHYTKINPQLSPQPGLLLKKYIDNGLLGVKTGRGFYAYDEKGNKIV